MNKVLFKKKNVLILKMLDIYSQYWGCKMGVKFKSITFSEAIYHLLQETDWGSGQ